jgi:hypothetical protein
VSGGGGVKVGIGVAVQAMVVEGITRVEVGMVAPAGFRVGVQVGIGEGEEVKVGIANRGAPDGRVGTRVAIGNGVSSLPERPGTAVARDAAASAGVLVGVGALPAPSLVTSPLHTTIISRPIVASARGSCHLRLDTGRRPS